MVQNAAEGKKDVRSFNAEQGCSYIEPRIVGNFSYYSTQLH